MAQTTAAANDQQSHVCRTLIMFGDSITQAAFSEGGTGSALADLYVRALDVQNRGLGGYTTKWGIPMAKQWLPRVGEDRAKTALMTIWFGANDSTLPGQLQHVPLDEFKQNLRDIVSMIRSPSSPYHSPETALLLITPPPINVPAWHAVVSGNRPELAGLSPDRNEESTRIYAEAVKQVGVEESVPVADAWSAMMAKATEIGESGLETLLYDGLHPSAEGYRVVTEVVKEAIASQLPDLHWLKVPKLYPYWADIPNGALGEHFKIHQ